MNYFLGVAFLITLSFISSSAQIPIPSPPTGHKNGSASAPVIFEVYVDLMCPDSAETYPTLVDIYNYYGYDKIYMNVHLFPLPYHRNAYLTAQAALGAETINSTSFWQFVNLMFQQQTQFNEANTELMTEIEIKKSIATMAQEELGLDYQVIYNGMADSDLDWNLRVDWKVGCSRGTAGTPWYFVNGAFINGDPSWTLDEWRIILDPLYPTSSNLISSPYGDDDDNTTCPKGQKLCQYLPGQYECCTIGESCIPNVGCRCFVEEEPTCPDGQELCQYVPGKYECCFSGEGCIPNVGCRC